MATQRPQDQLTRWSDHLERHLPHLTRPQRRSLALWSYAATITEHIGLTTCAALLAETLCLSAGTLRGRLRDFYRPAERKRGDQRTDLDVSLSFGPLFRWTIWLLRPRRAVLALDPTLCRARRRGRRARVRRPGRVESRLRQHTRRLDAALAVHAGHAQSGRPETDVRRRGDRPRTPEPPALRRHRGARLASDDAAELRREVAWARREDVDDAEHALDRDPERRAERGVWGDEAVPSHTTVPRALLT